MPVRPATGAGTTETIPLDLHQVGPAGGRLQVREGAAAGTKIGLSGATCCGSRRSPS
jgi:hypothetical protein